MTKCVDLAGLVAVVRALADRQRLRILRLLRGGELCLCQLTEVLRLAPSTVSRHLSVLEQAGLIVCRKHGRWHFYRARRRDAADPASTGLKMVDRIDPREGVLTSDSRRLRAVRKKSLEEVCRLYRK